MRRLWPAIWLAVLGWDLMLPHLDATSPGLGAVALVLAACLLITGRPSRCPVSRRLGLVLAGGLGAAALLLPRPEGLGPLLVAVGLVAAAIPVFPPSWRGNHWRVPGGLGALVTLLAALSHLYRHLESSYRDLDLAALPLAVLYRLLGVPAAADPPFVHLQGVGNLHTFDCTIEKLVGHGLALFVVSGVAALWILNGRRLGWRKPVTFLVWTALFAVARALALGLALDEVAWPTIYYARGWVFGGLLPLVAILAAFLPPVARGRPAPGPVPAAVVPSPRVAAALAAALAAGLLLAASLAYYDPGREKPGRITIDENHSNWEWSTVDLNTESYGVQTVYNYSELVRYLGHFYDIHTNFKPITDSLLSATDVMILKTPTRPYQDAEVDALVRFVERGGGLWLVGDHTNVFGMSTNLNKVGLRFGFRYRFDAVIDLRTLGRQLYQRPRLFAHPSVRHLPPILMATSSSMKASPLAQRVMVGQSLLSDWLDYSVNSFFGNFKPDPGEPFGSMLQAVAVTRGKGRVLGFSDSTIFSNFFMFIRGKPELALGTVRWLMRENRYPWARAAFLGLGLLALAAFAGLSLPLPRGPVFCGLALGLLGFAAAARGLDAWVSGWARLPDPRIPLPIVTFDRGKTDYEVPDIAELPDLSPRSFHTFYVWTQRVGYIPATRLFRNCLDDSRIVVLVNPRASLDPGELSRLQSYVKEGGGLLVMDAVHARHSTANSILEPFGLQLQYVETESVAVLDATTRDSVAFMGHAGRVNGGEPVWTLPDGSAVIARAPVGKGSVVALCASENFSDAVMGKNSDVPDSTQLALYRIQYRIFDEILRPPDREASLKSEN